jgi:hypothetical protein
VATVTTTTAASVAYAWTVSGPPAAQARIRATWTSSPALTDSSDVPFRIVSRVTVTAPNTAVVWGAGTRREVRWTHNLGLAERVDIALSADGGVTWIPVASNVANATATTGTFIGPLPAVTSTTALIRVSHSADPASFDVGDVVFTLAPPAITVTAPNTNVAWDIGSMRPVSWSHNLGPFETVGVHVSRDGGVTWTPILENRALGNTSGSYSWLVDGPATTQARIRVVWTDDDAVQDASNVNFRIR